MDSEKPAVHPVQLEELNALPESMRNLLDANLEVVQDLKVRLTVSVGGAQLSIGADMPSMPMAHNIKPVKAKPGSKPGEYAARLDLEMTGEWAVKLRLSGPVRDQLVLHYEFDEKGARPSVRRSGTPPRK